MRSILIVALVLVVAGLLYYYYLHQSDPIAVNNIAVVPNPNTGGITATIIRLTGGHQVQGPTQGTSFHS